jgi:alpha-galactosidase
LRSRIEGDTLSLIIERSADGSAHLVWFGPKSHEDLALPAAFPVLPASSDIPAGPILMPEHGRGFQGIAQVEGFCISTRRRSRLGQAELIQNDDDITLRAADPDLGLVVASQFRFDGDALVIFTRIVNQGGAQLSISRAASALLPAPDWASQVLTYSGAWGREGNEEWREWSTGRIEQVGRSGRPGFDGGPTLTLCDNDTGETHGRALTTHLAWSGSFRLAAERATDGSGQILAERYFAPGECVLGPSDQLSLPDAMIAISDTGLNGISKIFHGFVRRHSNELKRPVHFNTWEARYFEVGEASCIALAREAAEIGAERFVLDDGWFKGRRNDQTSLGDWTVDADLFPNGLGRLIKTVHELGMGFGLWLEPEMVSPDSDLCRAHPDWVLGYPDTDLTTGRNQLVLDVSLPQVQDYLFNAISALLDRYKIDYLKWDYNRELYPATRDGVDRSGAQTIGLYALLDRIRDAYPVEIESCASGGGRIDLGIGQRTDRFWTSDATDAIDRIRIQRAASLIIPAEKLGCHIGPSPNPMTGRSIPMAFRVLTALFGHLGIEADPGDFANDEIEILKSGFDLYKAHRDWMHRGRRIRLGTEPDVQILMDENGNQGLLRVDTPKRPRQARIRFAGLERDTRYTLTELTLDRTKSDQPLGEYRGAGLMAEGLDLDPGKAQTGRLIHFGRIG